MSVYVANFKPGDGTWTIVHDDAPGGVHTASVAPSTIDFVANPNGPTGSRVRTIAVICPVCHAGTFHPIGGGAQPSFVQELFIRLVLRSGCPCGAMAAARPAAITLAHIRSHVASEEGADRWAVGTFSP